MSEIQSPALPTQGVREETMQVTDPWQVPEWKVSGIFSDHMLLQRERPVTVWGWSSHIGDTVIGRWGEEQVQTQVSEEGKFTLTFAPRQACAEPSEMRISSPHGETVLTDILVGDVWLIGGQSNAELCLNACLADTPDIAADLDEKLPVRLFLQNQAEAAACTAYHSVPARDIICPNWQWHRPHEQAAKSFSAIGYYAARILHEQTKVPMGMVMMCAGGACLRELMSPGAARELGYTQGANVPLAGYYHTLIAPLEGLQFAGQIFFQGESEGIWEEMARSYDRDLAVFVADERRRFGVDFPFYNVQLSSYREEGAEFFPHLKHVRVNQWRARKLIPHYALAVSRDLGADADAPDWAHSAHKYPLACRLAGQILAREYGLGEEEHFCGPEPREVLRKGQTLEIIFDRVNGGLITTDGEVRGFSYATAEEENIPLGGEIIAPDRVRLVLPEGVQPTAIHYALMNIATLAEANLTGGSDIPVPAFTLSIE